MITFQNVSSEKQAKIFFFVEKLRSVLKIFKFLYFSPSYDLENLWRHDEYYYIRQGAFLNISFEPKLITSPNLPNWNWPNLEFFEQFGGLG